MYKILKSSLAFLMSFILCVQIFPVMATDETIAAKDVIAVDFTNRSVAQSADLYVSSLYKKSGKFTTKLSGKNLEKDFVVASRKDWSQHSAIQMWVYSPKGEVTPLTFALVSENPKTVGRDFYYVTAYVGALGWNSIYIPYNGGNSLLCKKGNPLGLDTISSVEILTQFDGEIANTNAEIYFDKMILTNGKTTDFAASADSIGGGDVVDKPSGEQGDNSYIEVCGDVVLEKSSVHLEELAITDWTKYNTLVIRATNEQKTDRAYDVNIYSENPATSGPDYYQFFIQADWEGTKEFSFDIRDGGAFVSSRTPLGWNQITKIIISTTESPLQKKWGLLENDRSRVQIDGIYLTNRDYTYLFADDSEDYIVDAKLEYISGIGSTNGYKDYATEIHSRAAEHPRLLIDGNYIEDLKELIKTDSYVNSSISKLKANVDSNLKNGPVTEPNTGAHNQLAAAALVYNIFPEQKYADYIWESMLNLTRNTLAWDRSNRSHLILGDTMRAVAYTYDWMYNHWTDSQRRIVRNAMMHYGMEISLVYLRPYKWYWGGMGGNWSQILMSGLGLTAIAMCDDPAYDDIVNEVLNRCVVGLSNVHSQTVSADGSYVEGASYWGYGMGNYIPFLAALYENTGADELMKLPGMDKTGLFPIGLAGPQGYYGFGDAASSGLITAGAFFFLSRYFDDPVYGAYQLRYTQGGVGDYRVLALYRPDERYKDFENSMPGYFHFPGENDALTIRRSWSDNNAAFLGVKAGSNTTGHGNLDIGSFIFDMLGVRWAYELGNDNYDDAYLYEDGKWVFYRNRAEGQNTLVINPDGSIDQNVYANCKIGDYKVNDNGAYVTMNITEAYEGKGVDSVKRGYALLNNYGALLVQDEIMSSSPVEVYTFMHTRANIEVAEDGKSAILTQDGQKMRARILSPTEGRFIDMPADPLPSSPNPPEAYPRTGYRKLAIHVENALSPTISMLLTPYQDDENAEFTIDTIKPISQFKNYIKDSVRVKDIYIDGVPLQDFNSGVSTYILENEIEVGEISVDTYSGVNVTIKQAEKMGDSAYVIAESDRTGNKAVYALSFSDKLQKMMDVSSYTPKNLISEVSPESANLIMDGDATSGWSITGSGWVGMDFGKPRELREVQVIWYKGNERISYFDIDVSDDGINWKTVLSSESTLSDSFDTYKFEPIKARYIRVYGKGNSSNNMTSICEVRVTAFEDVFADMSDHWAKNDVENLANLGLIQGLNDETFNPEGAMTRGEFAILMQKITGVSTMPYSGTFKDLSAESETTSIVEGLYSSGLIPEEMIKDGYFYPDKEITCEEAMAICVISVNKIGNMKPYYSSLDDYGYVNNISPWCLNYMKNAKALKLLNSSLMNVGFNPTANITRAQAAVLAKRVYVKLY